MGAIKESHQERERLRRANSTSRNFLKVKGVYIPALNAITMKGMSEQAKDYLNAATTSPQTFLDEPTSTVNTPPGHESKVKSGIINRASPTGRTNGEDQPSAVARS